MIDSRIRAGIDMDGSTYALLDQPSPRYPEVTFCSPEAD